MAVTRNKKDPGDLECKKVLKFFNKLKKNIKIDKKIKKIGYYVSSTSDCIYWPSICSSHSVLMFWNIDYDPHSYLPLDLSYPAQLIEAVQRSRAKLQSPKKKKKTINFNNIIKKNKYQRIENQLIYEKANEIASYLFEKSTNLKIIHSQIDNCTLSCGVNGVHQMRTRYFAYRCSDDKVCPLTFKVNYCQKSNHSELFEEPNKQMDCISYQNQEEFGMTVKCLVLLILLASFTP